MAVLKKVSDTIFYRGHSDIYYVMQPSITRKNILPMERGNMLKEIISRNPVITLSRVLGMLFIVTCHIIKYYTFIPMHESLGQFFNCGVDLFLFISGYLYGGKVVNRFGKWYFKRYLTVSFFHHQSFSYIQSDLTLRFLYEDAHSESHLTSKPTHAHGFASRTISKTHSHSTLVINLFLLAYLLLLDLGMIIP